MAMTGRWKTVVIVILVAMATGAMLRDHGDTEKKRDAEVAMKKKCNEHMVETERSDVWRGEEERRS